MIQKRLYSKDSLDCQHNMLMCSTVSRRSEPSSRITLTGEQTDPWHLLQRQDVMSRHRGSEPRRRYGRSGATTLLSPG